MGGGGKARVGNFWSEFFEYFSIPGRRSGIRSEGVRGRYVGWGGVCFWIHFDSLERV